MFTYSSFYLICSSYLFTILPQDITSMSTRYHFNHVQDATDLETEVVRFKFGSIRSQISHVGLVWLGIQSNIESLVLTTISTKENRNDNEKRVTITGPLVDMPAQIKSELLEPYIVDNSGMTEIYGKCSEVPLDW